MAKFNRETLKNYFKKGSFATEKHFYDLIDSSVNSVDDGLDKNQEDGLRLSPTGVSKRLMSFFKHVGQRDANWTVNINDAPNDGFYITNRQGQTSVFFKEDGKIGINTMAPENQLDVHGTLGVYERAGTYAKGHVPADGNWHVLMAGLDDVHCFEILAKAVGEKGNGKYAVGHFIASCVFGGRFSKNKISATAGHYGSFLNKIQICVKGSLHDYRIMIRTRTHYGVNEATKSPFAIAFHVTKLT